MSSAEYDRKLDELERLLNDPAIAIEPDRIWSLLDDVSRFERAFATSGASAPPA